MDRRDADVIVVGAGLTGLTTAFRLSLQGFKVEVFEAGPHAGGVIGTHRHDVDGGTVLYELGPNSGMDTTPLINQLLRDLGILDLRVDAQPAAAKRYILRNGRILRVPNSPIGFITTRLFSWRAKLGLLREPFLKPPAAPAAEQSVAAFVRRHLGQEMLDYAVEPFVGGVYAGDPELLSVDATFPRLAEIDRHYGSLVRGTLMSARARKRAEAATGERAKSGATSFNFQGGMQTLIDAFVRHLPRLVCAARVEAVRREAGGLFAIDVERLGERFTRRAGAVVLAMPAFEAAALVLSHGDAGAASAEALEAIHYPPVATASVIYRRKDVSHPLDGFGFLAPRIEAPPVLGTLFASSMFAGRAPASTVVLTSFVGGRRNPQAALAPDEHIAADVVRCNAHLLGAEPPLYTAVRRWPRAIPQYDLGHLQRVATVDEFEARVPGLVLCGNWRDGVSVSDCIKAGYKRAEQIAARVSQLPAAASSAGQHRALTAA